MEKRAGQQHREAVETYFRHVADVQAGKRAAVDQIISLWHPEGILTVLGATDADGWMRNKTYKGTSALRARYEAMAKAKSDLGVDVQFTVSDIHEEGDRVSAKVTATLSTGPKDGRSFRIERKEFAFAFDNGRIVEAREDVSWSDAVVAQRIALEALSVQDIGRLTLAAWAIA